jgi:16S rRNA (cytosine967-C5)-methyltransferase
VLRRLAAEAALPGHPTLAEAASASVPAWLFATLTDAVGAFEAGALSAAEPAGPWLGLCLRAGEPRDEWLARIATAAPSAELRAGEISPRALLLRGAGNPRKLPGAGDGWQLQEEGSQVVALAAGGSPGERVLDACAGRGTKSLLLAEAVGPGGAVDAADRDPVKLRRAQEAEPERRSIRSTFAVDWTQGPGEVPDGYDRALVDAPCTGLGTLRRRPELLHRLDRADPSRLAALQIAIVRQVATRIRSGGRLVYAVCSVSRAETQEVVDALAGEPRLPARLVPCEFSSSIGQRLAAGGTSFRLLPGAHGTDGYFVASFRVER